MFLLSDRVAKVYESMEQAMLIGQLRYKFHLKKDQLVKVLDKAAKLTNVLVNHLYNIVDYFPYINFVFHEPD